MRVSTTLLLTLPHASAHFVLNWPPNAGFDEDKEPTSPCGGFTPSHSASSPSLSVDRFQVLIQNVHPVGQWSFRGTNSTQEPYEFQELVPLVNTTGVSNFCLEYLVAPSEWAGKSGVLQVVDNSPDGVLYQCAAVNWVSGSNDTVGAACANSSSAFTASWTTLEGFKGEAGGSVSATASALMSSSTGAAATATAMSGLVLGGLGALAAGFVL